MNECNKDVKEIMIKINLRILSTKIPELARYNMK